MKKLVINADDFGMTKEISDAVIDVYKSGSISSATLMSNMPGTDYAIKLAKENPKLGVGLHFNITEGKSTIGSSSLTKMNGAFLGKMSSHKKIWIGAVKLEDVRAELSAQYEYLTNSGIQPTHIDSHQHIHMNPRIFPLVADFAKAMKVNLRIAYPQVLRRSPMNFNVTKWIKQQVLTYAAQKNKKYAQEIKLATNDSFNSIFDFHPFQSLTSDDYKILIQNSNSSVHELMVHPYQISKCLDEIYAGDIRSTKQIFFNKAQKEFDVLKEFSIRNWIQEEKLDIQVINFGDV